MSWEKKKIGDYCEITSSKRIFYSEYVDSGVPFYRSKEIIEASQGQPISEPLYISQEKYNDIKAKFGVPVPGDMLLTSVGTIGIPYIVRADDFFYFKDGNLTWFRNFDDALLSKYLFYWMGSKEGYGVLNNSTIGSSQKALTIASLKQIEFPLPPIEVQERIVDILSAYDDLIENNQKQIKLLEEAAQRLYKQWFIDLRYPGHETTKIVDGLPQGWKKCRIDERFKTVLGGTPSRANPNYWNGNIAWINSGEVNNLRIMKASEYITELALEKSATKMMPVHTTVIAITGATLGQVSYTEIETCANQSVVGIIDETELFSMYLYLFVSTNIKSMIGKATGGAQQHINKDIVNEYKIILPEERVIKKLNILTAPIFNKIADCYRQIEKLTESRDRLLPKLVNGELEV